MLRRIELWARVRRVEALVAMRAARDRADAQAAIAAATTLEAEALRARVDRDEERDREHLGDTATARDWVRAGDASHAAKDATERQEQLRVEADQAALLAHATQVIAATALDRTIARARAIARQAENSGAEEARRRTEREQRERESRARRNGEG
ncbi:MAG: hypothetical protein ACHREM_18780 [Polyangiales bacterium]